MNAKPVGAIAAITQALLDLIAHFVSLLALESKVIALDLAWVSGLVISAAGLAISGWLVMLACVALILVQNGIIGWVSVLALASLSSFAGVAILIAVIVRWRHHPVFPATRRQLIGLGEGTDSVIKASGTLELAEQQVVEARTAVIGEYHLAQARLQHRVESPILLGGVFLGAIGVGYLSTKHGKSRGHLWRGVLTASQVLLPLWLAIKAAPKSAEK
jgi:hypothetical protein